MRLLSYDELKPRKGIGYSKAHLWRLEKEHKFPKRVPLGESRHGWIEDEIDNWILERAASRVVAIDSERSEGIACHHHINDSATEEPDFPSLHPQLLYAQVGRHLPHDPYDLDGWDRPTVKRAFNIMLNAKTLGSAELAVAEAMGGFTNGHREQAKRLIAEIEHKHAPVAEYFGSGMGRQLQRIDSDIAARVLAKSTKDGECLLSLHDGFRSRRQYADRTREIMDEAFEKVVGQVPAISTLKRKADLQIWSPVVGWLPPPLPLPASLVVSLPPGLASLVVVSSFYSGSVIGLERAA